MTVTESLPPKLLPAEAEAPESPGADGTTDEEALVEALAELGEALESHQESVQEGFVKIGEQLRTLTERVQESVKTRQKEREAAELAILEAKAAARDSDGSDSDSEADSPEAASKAETSEQEIPLSSPAAPDAFIPAAIPSAQPIQRAQPVQRAQPAPQWPGGGGADDAWEEVIFADELASGGHLAGERRELIDGLSTGDAAAAGLVGQLLIFRAALPDRMPQLLKDVGEAYYEWRPHTAAGDDAMREAIIEWLLERCGEHGVNNRIDLVRPGDRFDRARHNSKQPGGEVDDVYGWIVLRDNGKVYTKATVAAK